MSRVVHRRGRSCHIDPSCLPGFGSDPGSAHDPSTQPNAFGFRPVTLVFVRNYRADARRETDTNGVRRLASATDGQLTRWTTVELVIQQRETAVTQPRLRLFLGQFDRRPVSRVPSESWAGCWSMSTGGAVGRNGQLAVRQR
jgi:hypothetical protein